MPPIISYIFIATPPNKTTYFVGELFDPTGMVVKAHYTNGTNQTINMYTYGPNTQLTTDDHEITIMYQLFSVKQTINVIPALIIDSYPNKLNYHVGESFDPTGMVIKFYNGSVYQPITNYSYSPSGLLSLNDSLITVSYNGYSTYIPIGVSNSTLTGPFPGQDLSNANLGNNPFYNLFDQSIRFTTNPISVNRDSYTLSFTLTYYSRVRERLSSYIKGLSHGFISNYHQYLLEDGTDSLNHPIYKYIDGEGYIHTFKYVSTNLYYSHQIKLFLTVDALNSTYPYSIIDGSGNELHFDASGRLNKITSNKGENNNKYIVYNGDYIDYIYDERFPTTKIVYSYNNLNQLNEVSFAYKNSLIKKLSFIYSNGLLTTVNEIDSSNNSRTLYTYLYNYNHVNSSYDHIEYINDHLNNVVYSFHYFYDSSYDDYVVDRFSSGVFNNSGVFITKDSLTKVSHELRNDNTTSQLIIRNHNNLFFTYHLDKNALITASFESDEYGLSLKTLYKESGVYFDINGNLPTSINTHPAKNITAPLTLSAPAEAYNLFPNYKHFVFRMYIKINDDAVNIVKCSVNSSFIANSDAIYLNVDQYNKYQLIEIPFTKNNGSLTNISFTLSFKDENDDDVDVDIADVYLDKKERTSLKFDNGSYDFNDVCSLYLYDTNSNPNNLSVSSYPFFSEGDFLQTLFFKENDILSSLANGYLLYLSNGKAFDTYNAYFNGLDSYEDVVIDYEHLGNGNIEGNDCWYFLTESADGLCESKTFYRFVEDNDDKYYEVITRKLIQNNQNEWEQEIKRYDFKNKLLKIIKSHKEGVIVVSSETVYSYFANDEIQSIIVTDGNESIVLYEATQNSDHYIQGKTSGLNSVYIAYDGYLENYLDHKKVENGIASITLNTKNFTYDSFKDILTNVSFMHYQNNKGNNGLINDYSNNQILYTINNSSYYKLVKDSINDILTLKRYDGSSFEDVILVKETPSLKEITYCGQYPTLTISSDVDIYGKTLNIKEYGDTIVTYNYENNPLESLTVIKNLTSVNDGYANSQTSYLYNGIDYYELSNLNNYFEIQRLYNGFTKYCFANDEVYIVEPLAYNQDVCEYSTMRIDNVSVKHSFDAFNRLISKQRLTSGNSSNCFLEDVFVYQINSMLCSQYSHKNLSNKLIDEEYEYDHFGNLYSASIIARNYNLPNANIVSYTKTFNYDGFNRLTLEHNPTIQVSSRTYSYNEQGRMAYFGDNQLVYNAKGQLSSFGTITYTYDTYGNRTKKTENNIDTSYHWSQGKRLRDINQTIFFNYDYRGLRCSKDTNKETIIYFYDGHKLIGEDHIGKTYQNQTYPSFKLRFFYDNDDTPIGLRYINGNIVKDYAYIVNPFKEIVGLSYHNNSLSSLESSLEAIYIYDAWGNHKVYNALGNLDTDEYSIGNINPLRYKAYYYDKESGLYYLLSRYYDPSIGQFISPDDYAYLDINKVSGYHLYAYCSNDTNELSSFEKNSNLFIARDKKNASDLNANLLGKKVTSQIHIKVVDNTNNVKIYGSHFLINPFDQWFYAFRLNYLEEKTKNVICGSTIGLQYEILVHNVWYYVCSVFDTYKGQADPTDVGPTIHSNSGWVKAFFELTYPIYLSLTLPWPLSVIVWVYDLIRSVKK